jgi:hypothetical protein
LIFIYTDTLPDGSDGALLEDLMAADRYGLGEMKELVENMLKPSLFNWMDLLRASELLSLQKLRNNVMNFLRDNFHVLSPEMISRGGFLDDEEEEDSVVGIVVVGSSDEKKKNKPMKLKSTSKTNTTEVVSQWQEEFPGLFEEILSRRSSCFPAPPSRLLIEEGKLTKESALAQEKRPFPFWALAMAAVCLYFYQAATQILPIGPLVPVVNMIGLAGLLLYGFRVLYTSSRGK